MNSEKNDSIEYFESPCGYFDGLTAQAEVYFFPSIEESVSLVDSDEFPQEKVFDFYLSQGFRRNGGLIYRETCPSCKQCVPIRIPAQRFRFSKKQRYLLRKNSDINISVTGRMEDFATREKVELMKQYNQRHESGKVESDGNVRTMLMDMNGLLDLNDEPLREKVFSGTINVDYRLNGKLVGCSIIDAGHKSLSSNYFYYDISEEIMKRGIGTFSILAEILIAQGKLFGGALKSPYYYLGYWISNCRKMSYKANFMPHEILVGGEWKLVEKGAIS